MMCLMMPNHAQGCPRPLGVIRGHYRPLLASGILGHLWAWLDIIGLIIFRPPGMFSHIQWKKTQDKTSLSYFGVKLCCVCLMFAEVTYSYPKVT